MTPVVAIIICLIVVGAAVVVFTLLGKMNDPQ